MSVSGETAAAGGDVLLYRYVVREIGQTSTITVDACRVGLVACDGSSMFLKWLLYVINFSARFWVLGRLICSK